MATVFLGEYIHPSAVEKLKKYATVVNTFENPEAIDAIILRTFEVNAKVMDQCPNLKVIGKHGVGVNTIDLNAAKERGIAVFNTPLANANSVAELIVGLMLIISRNILTAHEKSKAGEIKKVAPAEMTGMELSGKTLGLIGTGNIARIVGKICENGFGMKVIGYDPFVSREAMEKLGYEKYDIVVANILADILVPLTPVIIKQMKPGGIYITSGIIDNKEETVVNAVKAAGLEIVEVTYQGEWVSVTARKQV